MLAEPATPSSQASTTNASAPSAAGLASAAATSDDEDEAAARGAEPEVYPRVILKLKLPPTLPKRPTNAFMIFCNEVRASYRELHPDEKMSELSKRMAADFNALSAEARAAYTAKAEAEKARYSEEVAKLGLHERQQLTAIKKPKVSTEALLQKRCEAEADAFWAAAEARLPSSARYLHKLVPQCARDLAGCALVAPADRTEWFMCLGEMVSLCEEATRRHASALGVSPAPQAMPVAYLAERLDTDEPLWGWQVRDRQHGWMQGFVTLTTFTTWSATFEFCATLAESGLPAGRSNTAILAGRGRATTASSESGAGLQAALHTQEELWSYAARP